MKTLKDFISEGNSPEQLDESTMAGKAEATLNGNSFSSVKGTVVFKTDGRQPNAEFNFRWSEGGNMDLSISYSKGEFDDKRFYFKFNNVIKGTILGNFDKLETAFITGNSKQAEKILKDLGVRNLKVN